MWIFIEFLKFTWFYWPSRHHTYLMIFHLCIYIFMYLLMSSYIWVYDWCKIGVVKIFLTVSESNWCKLIVTKLLILVLARYFLSKNGVNLLHHKICLLFSFWISFVKRSSVTWLYNSIVIFIEDDPWYPAMFLELYRLLLHDIFQIRDIRANKLSAFLWCFYFYPLLIALRNGSRGLT